MVTEKLLRPMLPALSVAEQITVVGPRSNVDPEAGVQLVVTRVVTASLAETSKLTTAPSGEVASLAMSAGTLTTGAVVSSTVTTKELSPMFPAASLAEQV